MADLTAQLPKMPTSLGVNQNPTAAAAPAAASAIGRFLTQPFTPPAATPAPPVSTNSSAPTTAVSTNPYAPNGVVPAVASPEAIAAFRASIAPPVADMARAAAPAPAPAPGSDQIRFIDKNSPRVGVAAPNVIRGGIPAGGLTNRDVSMLMPLVPPIRSAAERASHELMDIYGAQHQADIDVARAQASGDPAAIAEATARQLFLKGPETARHILNLKSVGLPALGTVLGERGVAAQ